MKLAAAGTSLGKCVYLGKAKIAVAFGSEKFNIREQSVLSRRFDVGEGGRQCRGNVHHIHLPDVPALRDRGIPDRDQGGPVCGLKPAFALRLLGFRLQAGKDAYFPPCFHQQVKHVFGRMLVANAGHQGADPFPRIDPGP